LDIQKKAKFGQEKLGLSKTNKSHLSCVNIFCSTGTVTILTTDVFSIWTGALCLAYIIGHYGSEA